MKNKQNHQKDYFLIEIYNKTKISKNQIYENLLIFFLFLINSIMRFSKDYYLYFYIILIFFQKIDIFKVKEKFKDNLVLHQLYCLIIKFLKSNNLSNKFHHPKEIIYFYFKNFLFHKKDNSFFTINPENSNLYDFLKSLFANNIYIKEIIKIISNNFVKILFYLNENLSGLLRLDIICDKILISPKRSLLSESTVNNNDCHSHLLLLTNFESDNNEGLNEFGEDKPSITILFSEPLPDFSQLIEDAKPKIDDDYYLNSDDYLSLKEYLEELNGKE